MSFVPSQKYELIRNAEMANGDFTTVTTLEEKRGRPRDRRKGIMRLVTWLIPGLIAGLVGFAVFAGVYRDIVAYLLRRKHERTAGIVFLVLLGVFLYMTAICYMRTLYTVKTNPGLVPLTHATAASDAEVTISAFEPQRLRETTSPTIPDIENDVPGSDWFYDINVFSCESDGLPRWCSECRQRKPDRAHHSSELGRCVYKMDHYCPWVGGVVSETSFRFFTQFTMYGWIFCAVLFSCNIYTMMRRKRSGDGLDPVSIICAAISGFFGFFCFCMTATSIRYILINMTNIEVLRDRLTQYIAVRVPNGTISTNKFRVMVYPLDLTIDLFPGSMGGRLDPTRGNRTFAVLLVPHRMNPWDLGWRRNWIEVMGSGVSGWFFPVGKPGRHHGVGGEYQTGKVVERLKKQYNVPKLCEHEHGYMLG